MSNTELGALRFWLSIWLFRPNLHTCKPVAHKIPENHSIRPPSGPKREYGERTV